MPDIKQLLENYAGSQITGHVVLPSRPSRFGEWGSWVPESVLAALRAQGIARPWAHQAQAADLLHSGQNVVLASGTGSGKSLAAWVPALAAIVEGRKPVKSLAQAAAHPTVLYLSPTKALAADQEKSLARLAAAVDPSIAIATVDGDADSQTRSFARTSGDILLTNPDFAHLAMLGRRDLYNRLWRGLTYIVLDEFHSYRGAFAANVALVVRRMMRVARHLGADPKVIFLSATAAKPQQAAERFLGPAFGPVVPVEEDGSPAGQKDIFTLVTKPLDDDAADAPASLPHSRDFSPAPTAPGTLEDDDLPTDTIRRQAANTEAGQLTAHLVAAGAQALTFVRSRAGTERVAEVARESLEYSAPHLAGTVAAYRGGYLPEERRQLEAELRSGNLRALATTSALELGIDISGLDAVVVTGWPGTQASFRQQIGRAGRAGGDGVAALIGRDNPLDEYILAHPEVITEPAREVAAFDPANPWILPGHLCSAASEVPLTDADAQVFSLDSTAAFERLAEEGMLRERPGGWYWNATLPVSPHELVDIRGGGQTVSIIDADSGTLLGTVDEGRADHTVFPGAIYLHQGVAFLVESLDGEVALVRRHLEGQIRTYAREHQQVDIVRTDRTEEHGKMSWNLGQVVIDSKVVGYDVRRLGDGMYVGTFPLNMPTRRLETSAVWFTMPEGWTRDIGIQPADLPGALHAAEHTMIGLLPLFATCDRWDIGGLSTALHAQTGQPTIIIHDAMAGGSGCAERGFGAGLAWLEATADVLATCPCASGCPRCVQSPKCGNNNEPLDKAGALTLLRELAQQWRHSAP